MAANDGLSDEVIAATLKVSGSTIYRTKRRFVEANLEGALSEEPRPGVERKLSSKEEALLVATACSKPPGFVGTSWELRAESAALHAPAFDDYPGAFKDAGFEIEIYEETRNRRRLLTDAISAVVASDDAIRREVEGPAAERLLRWARARPGELDHSRRVRFSVQRPV